MNAKLINLKLSALLEYFHKIVAANSKLIKNVDRYEKCLWFDDIANAKNCKLTLISPEEENNAPNVILEVSKEAAPEKPSIPEMCQKWITKTKPDDPEDQKLLPEIESADGESVLSLADHQEVSEAWNDYMQSLKSWEEKYKEWQQRESIYEKFYSMYKEYEKDKDGLEVIIGIGLFQNTKTFCSFGKEVREQIKRHLLTIKVDFEQEIRPAKPAKFVVKIFDSACVLKPELEVIDEDLNKTTTDKVADLIDVDSSLTKSNLKKIFTTILNSAYANGEYKECEKVVFPDKPTITLSPALILRKKSNRGAISAIESLQLQLNEQNANLPPNFLKLIGQKKSGERCGVEEESHHISESSEIFFPKPSNYEQESIVRKLNNSTGVVVQGPPGTGKSHTIANIICHLLANGQRVLVTAKTSTALSVLRNLLPEDVRSLCVTKTGNSDVERKDLETSIFNILNKSETWNESKEKQNTNELIQKLQKYREQKAKYENQLRDTIKSEADSFSINKAYIGTLTDIVKKINEEKTQYDWFEDLVDETQMSLIDFVELEKILSEARRLKDKREILNLRFETVSSPQEFSDNIAKLQQLSELCNKKKLNDKTTELRFSDQPIEKLNKLLSCIEELQNQEKKILSYSHEYSWIEFMLNKIYSGVNVSLPISVESSNIPDIEEAQDLESYEIEYKTDFPEKRILDDAKILIDYIKNGGKISFVTLLLPKPVRNATYIFKNVLINKKVCSPTEEDLDILIRRISLDQKINKITLLLGDIACDIQDEDSAIRKTIKLSKIAKILSEIKTFKDSFFEYSSLVKSMISKDNRKFSYNLDEVSEACLLSTYEINKNETELFFSDLTKKLSFHDNDKSHPIMRRLNDDVKNKDISAYEKDYEVLSTLLKEKEQMSALCSQISKLRKIMPKFIANMLNTCENQVWDKRIQCIEKAIHWRQAKAFIEERMNGISPDEIKITIGKLDREIRNAIAKLASQKAWHFCLKKLTSTQKKNIELWRQTLNKIGKGTGKYVGRYLREAKNYFDKAKDAIPAWIMPLYSVWDSIKMQEGSFDVIIVDEASQCGIDTIPLLFLGKKVIIVGDDKQMSPDNVGIDREKTHKWLDEYLSDFGDDKSIFDVDRSLFDIGNILFNDNKVVLREHFRCMPEIIRFSNKNWYAHSPLIPLRQHGSDRLIPLIHKFVEDGYTKNDGTAMVNIPETNSIIDFVLQICSNEKYKNKTIGILVLQGKGQIDLIERELLRKVGENEISKHKIKCGSFEHFQGDERDVMILSMVIGSQTKFKAISAVSYQQRYNVAMSRARDQVILFHSVKPEDLSSQDLRRKLLEFFETKFENEIAGSSLLALEKIANDQTARKNEEKPLGTKFDSWFELDVAIEIMKKGYLITPQYEVAGRRIDIVIEGEKSRFAVECDGDRWHGADKYEDDMKRQRQLERNGWEFFRIPASSFYYDKSSSLNTLWPLLEERGILPCMNN